MSNDTKKSFIQVWKELTFFLVWFALAAWVFSSVRDDKPWLSLAWTVGLFLAFETLYLTGYWVFVGFKKDDKAQTP